MEKGHCHNGRQDFDHALLDDDDRDKFEAGDMCIVDLTDDDGPPNFGLPVAKITVTAVLVNLKEEFDLHWFGTYSKAKSLAKRAYVPAYIDSRDDLEIYTWKKTKNLRRNDHESPQVRIAILPVQFDR